MSEARHRHHTQRAIGQLLQQLEKAGATITAAEHPQSMSRARARDIVKNEILRTIRAAFITYPELSEGEVLDACESALTEILIHMDRF
jgi:hypothetical protein